ncbi:hypothetical protein [Streptococcus hyovaginalis]|uniref:hypothetical protein n=1 Tax=Streptococcus hyovaginalis TaxID=149015 RepID=UPI002A90E644|nr:hypothetical protein [Streptococcus hyovaginalis]MDY5973341.1 hypothetical protein [Streptococcus hyovaginalis]
MKSEFNEKSFETAINNELQPVFSPGQVAEKILGFDATANPGPTHKVWAYLGIHSPQGIILTPSNWSNQKRQPTKEQLGVNGIGITSLILQYKRSDYLNNRNSKQASYWNKPYYRFEIEENQQEVLENLEISLTGYAAVRYAAPCFHLAKDLYNYSINQKCLENTGFVKPSNLLNHKYWTYTDPGTSGYANPFVEAENIRFDNIHDLSNQLNELPNGDLEEILHVTSDSFQRIIFNPHTQLNEPNFSHLWIQELLLKDFPEEFNEKQTMLQDLKTCLYLSKLLGFDWKIVIK